jgi:transposase
MISTEIQTRDPDQLLVIIDEQDQEIEQLKEALRLLRHNRFGASQESFNALQVPLFPIDEGEYKACLEQADNDKTVVPAHQRRKPKNRVTLADHLPRERVEVDLSEEEKTCPCCQAEMTKIGEDITKTIEFVPATLFVKEYARAKYACKHCEGHIQRADIPPMILPKSLLSASILAYIIVSKFVDHLPLHRIERQFERLGCYLPRGLQCRGLLKVAEQLAILIQIMSDDIRAGPVIATDDTIMPLQNDIPGRKRTIQGRLWVYRGGPPGVPPLIVFRFTRTRSQSEPLDFFKGYKGYLMSDGYPGYQLLFKNSEIKHVACNVHSRRKFVEVVRSTKKVHRAHDAIAMYKQLYKVENVVKILPMNERSAYRQEHAVPILKQMEAWLLDQQSAVLPKSKLGNAINYCLNLWPALTRYVEADYLKPDNNEVERIVRSAALGRKNYLFAGSERGGEAIATFYSLVESAKAHNLNVLHYLTDVLERLPYCKATEDYLALTPNRWNPCNSLN